MADRPDYVNTFWARHREQVEYAARETGIPPSVLMAQWGCESNWGRSELYLAGNNFVGMKKQARHRWAVTIRAGEFAGFDSYGECAQDYVWLLTEATSSKIEDFRGWAGYTRILTVAKAHYTGMSDPEATLARAKAVCRALGESKYDSGGYGRDADDGYAGKTLVDWLGTFGLLAYDPPIQVAPWVGAPGPTVPEVGEQPKEYTRTWLQDRVDNAWTAILTAIEPALKAIRKAVSAPAQGALLIAAALVILGLLIYSAPRGGVKRA